MLILTTFNLDEYVFDALRAGASGFLLKDVAARQLASGLRTIAAGEALLAPAITRHLIEEFTSRMPVAPPVGMEHLTAREQEIFHLIATGHANLEIADELVISHATVKTHVARIRMKLGLRDRIQVAILAYESGIINPAQVHEPRQRAARINPRHR